MKPPVPPQGQLAGKGASGGKGVSRPFGGKTRGRPAEPSVGTREDSKSKSPHRGPTAEELPNSQNREKAHSESEDSDGQLTLVGGKGGE